MMKRYPALIALITVICLTAKGELSPLILDQESDDWGGAFNVNADWLTWQQEVTVGLEGQLMQVDLSVDMPGTAVVSINAGSPWQSDAPDFTTTLTATSPGWTSIDTSSARLFFDVGDTFVIQAVGTNSGLRLGGGHVNPPGGPYGRGELWLNEENYGDEWDIAFRTYVPEPATILMLGLGGAAVVGKNRRKG